MGLTRELIKLTLRKLKRLKQNYNIHERVDRILEKEKPKIAPRHKEIMHRVPKSYSSADNETEINSPKPAKYIEKHDSDLLKRLEKVYVTSSEEIESITGTGEPNPKKPLPVSRTANKPKEFGYYIPDPEKIPPGKITLETALDILNKYQIDPKLNTIPKLAAENKLDENILQNVVKHFYTFQLIVPANYNKDPTLDGLDARLKAAAPGGTHSITVLQNKTEQDKTDELKAEEDINITEKKSSQ